MKARILLVDDNSEFLDSTKDVLEDELYEVMAVDSGTAALKYVETYDFDVVIMDLKMPGMSGIEAFKEMKKIKSNLNVIICTAYMMENAINRALNEGARAVINKPFDMHLLLITIKDILQQANHYDGSL
jgi:CheY-like chemotaxis protein